MGKYLLRGDAPFSEEIWGRIDEMVVRVVKHSLVGRRVVELVGPLGWGVEMAPLIGFSREGEADVATGPTQYLPLREIGFEFMIRAKHLAMAEQTPFSLDLGAAAIAATRLALAEDKAIVGGLMEAASCHGAVGEWGTVGGPFRALSEAIAGLRNGGYPEPYAMVLNASLYARLASLMQQGIREIKLVKKLFEGGIFQTPVVPDGQVLVLSLGAWNFDMVLGQDVMTAYLGNEGLDHRLRIFETLALRVKRPGAICHLQ